MDEIEASACPQDFAREVALDIFRSERFPDGDEGGQLSLF
jgi:hypothetical protein